jgi:uncharacterized pyridoxal phosphate-containing UPF0001 family protein
VPEMPEDTRWHFVGHLQSKKVKTILEGCPHLAMLETVDSSKLANKLNAHVATMERKPLDIMLQVLQHVGPLGGPAHAPDRLAITPAPGHRICEQSSSLHNIMMGMQPVFAASSYLLANEPQDFKKPFCPLPAMTSPLICLQVNTSGEESKFGVEPKDAVPLAQHVCTECPHLRLAGLMTIGQPDYSSRPENFACLLEVRKAVADALKLDPGELELSMGMSGDFEQAIEMGSTNVRVGSTIFGARDYSK